MPTASLKSTQGLVDGDGKRGLKSIADAADEAKGAATTCAA